ncbi:MAG: hypothetical protein ACI4MN_03580 [Candidatus Coproplasma sp.]
MLLWKDASSSRRRSTKKPKPISLKRYEQEQESNHHTQPHLFVKKRVVQGAEVPTAGSLHRRK